MKVKSLLVFFSISFLIFFSSAQGPWRFCIRVIDGDTIVLDGNERVRLIGVDTPETKDPRKPVQYFGQEAYEFTKRLVEGKRVRLEYDVSNKDRYGRTLAYVYLEDFYRNFLFGYGGQVSLFVLIFPINHRREI